MVAEEEELAAAGPNDASLMAVRARLDPSKDARYAATGGRSRVVEKASAERNSRSRKSAPFISYSTCDSAASSSASPLGLPPSPPPVLYFFCKKTGDERRRVVRTQAARACSRV